MIPEVSIIMDVITPDNGSEIIIGDSLPVGVKAFSAKSPLANFELWVDGQLFAQDPASGNMVIAGWVWQALYQGFHTFFVRVKDSQEHIGQSHVVILNVLKGDGIVQIPSQEGQTLDEIGAKLNVDSDQMKYSNPAIDPPLPLQDGQPVHWGWFLSTKHQSNRAVGRFCSF